MSPADGPGPSPEARPAARKPLDAEAVERLASIGCTLRDIAYVYGCDEKTVRNRFRAEYERGQGAMRISLRRKQFKKAVTDENVVMLIWLGKQYLGQSDKSRQEIVAEFSQAARDAEELKVLSIDELRLLREIKCKLAVAAAAKAASGDDDGVSAN